MHTPAQQRLCRHAVEMRRKRYDRSFGVIRSGSDLGGDMRDAELLRQRAGAVLVAVDQGGDGHCVAGERAGQVAQLGDRPAPDDGDAHGLEGGSGGGLHRRGFWQQAAN